MAAIKKLRTDKAKALFDTYDVDKSGSLSLDEFTDVVQRYDPSIDAIGVEKSFEVHTPIHLRSTA